MLPCWPVTCPSLVQKKVVVYGYYVTAKNTPTHRGERMHFGTFLDRDGRFYRHGAFPASGPKIPLPGKG